MALLVLTRRRKALPRLLSDATSAFPQVREPNGPDLGRCGDTARD
jgi:hypothetical protein